MREIKFRGWHKKDKRMFFNMQDAYDTLQEHFPEELKDADADVQDAYIVYDASFGHVLKNDDWIVMQYTGLKDKNGKEIYEGDILRAPALSDKGTCEVFWGAGANNCWGIRTKDGGETGLTNFGGKWSPEVIGNIYENGDLLK